MSLDKKKIIDLFFAAQKTTAVHQKNAAVLNEILKRCDEDDIFEVFTKNIINKILIVDKKSQNVEKTMEFLATFCSLLESKIIYECESANGDDDEEEVAIEHPLVRRILVYLLKASGTAKDGMRLRACQIINKIIDKLVGVEISEDLCDQFEKSLIQRLQDTKSAIRQQAVITLYRLQDPENPDDTVIPEFIHLMNTDTCPKVRQLCIEKLSARRDVIGHMINRIRDVSEPVRIAALKRLKNFAKCLKIVEKRQVLQWAFADKCEKVRDVVSALIEKWIADYDHNVLKFLESIRFDATENDIRETVLLYEHILRMIFKIRTLSELTKQLPIDDEANLVPMEKLSWEVASYWRIYVEFLSGNEEFEEERDKVLPSFANFSNYIREYSNSNPGALTAVEFLERQFIFKQLFLITHTYDYSDVWNRKCLNALVSHILETTLLMADVTEVVVDSLVKSIGKVEQRTEFVNRIISEILYPMKSVESTSKQQDKQFQVSKSRLEINRLNHQLEEAVKQEEFILAEEIKQKLETEKLNLANMTIESPVKTTCKKTDMATTVKCLDIAASILRSPQITTLTSSLRSLKEDYVQDLLLHDNPTIQFKAMRCYALCCTIDKPSASTGIHMFSTLIFRYTKGDECDKETLHISVMAVTDLLRKYGSQLMAAPEMLSESMDEIHQEPFAGGTSLTEVLQGLADMMDDEDLDNQEIAGKALCQLLLSDSIRSPSLTSRLILKWCNPVTDNRVSIIIGHTLEQIPLIPEQCDQLKEAVIITLRTIVLAPRTSPFADVDVENASRFMLALLRTSSSSVYIIRDLARMICSEIKRNPRSRVNAILSKMLLLLDIAEGLDTDDLLKICDELKDEVGDRLVINNIVKFSSNLSKTLEETPGAGT